MVGKATGTTKEPFVSKLIDMMEQRNFMYDISSVDYVNRIIQASAFKALMDELGLTVTIKYLLVGCCNVIIFIKLFCYLSLYIYVFTSI